MRGQTKGEMLKRLELRLLGWYRRKDDIGVFVPDQALEVLETADSVREVIIVIIVFGIKVPLCDVLDEILVWMPDFDVRHVGTSREDFSGGDGKRVRDFRHPTSELELLDAVE